MCVIDINYELPKDWLEIIFYVWNILYDISLVSM